MRPEQRDTSGATPLRILHITWGIDAALGGGPAAATQMARAEATQGIDATIVATRAGRASDMDPEILEMEGIRGLLFRRGRFSRYSYSRSLGRWLEAHVRDYDMVEIHGVFNYPCLEGGHAARHASVPYVVHPHGQLDPFDLQKHRRLKRFVGPSLVRPLLAGARRILTASPLEGDRLETYGAPVTVDTLPLPYLVKDDGADRDGFRARHSLVGSLVVLFLGRIDYKKGLTYLIDAFTSVISRVPNAKLMLAGDDRSTYAAAIRNRIRRLKLDEYVLLVGTLDLAQKSSALAVADVLALVSDNENYGLVLVEAAWWEVPMLISREVYIGTTLEAAGAAMVVDRDPEAVAEALVRLLSDQALRRSMGAAGRVLASSAFSWDRCAAAHAALRRRLIEDQHPSR